MVQTLPKIDKVGLIGSLLKIDNKVGVVVPFRFNKVQEYFSRNKGYRNIVLKARQEGVSSSILADMFTDCILLPNMQCAVVSHETKATQRLLDRVQFYYDTMEEPRPVLGAESRAEKTFPELHSSIYIGTAGARAFSRGDTIRKALLSEIAFYEDGEKILSGIEDSVPLEGELTLECYDDKTEILSEQGWYKFKDLPRSVRVLSKDRNTNKAYWSLPIKYFKGRADTLLQFKGKVYDLAVTPNHSIWAKKRDQIFSFFPASDIADYSEFNLDCSLDWEGKEIGIFLLGSRRIPMDLWLEYLGYFLSEGWVDKYSVSIYQDGKYTQAMKEAAQKLASCLRKELGCYADDRQFCIFDKDLTEYLSHYTKPKRIPRELLNLSKRQLSILLEAYLKGDGYKHGQDKECSTVDIPLRDGLQELGLKLGYRTSYYTRGAGKDSRGVNRRESYTIHFSKQLFPSVRKKRNQVTEILYNGLVYCVTLQKDNLLMVRRNGKAIWCGNSTANGETNVNGDLNIFYKTWVEAREGKSSYKPFFFPWWLDVGYSIPRDCEDNKILELLAPEDRSELVFTDEEKELIERVHLSESQIRWRRFKIREKKGRFWIEYPENEVDCFIITGDPVFDSNLLTELANLSCDGQKHPKGWTFWLPPQEGLRYVIGVDTSSGAPEGSYSAACVVNNRLEVCASFQARVDPGTLAKIIKDMGIWYNTAELTVERNFTGYAVLEQLKEYPNVSLQRDFTTGKLTDQRGWWSNDQTRSLIMSIAKENLSQVKIWDANLVRQLRSYRYMKLRKKYREEAQTFDDLAIAFMLALASIKTGGTALGYRGSVPGYSW